MKTVKLTFLFVGLVLFAACDYSPESLSSRFSTDYELALPIINDTLKPYDDFQVAFDFYPIFPYAPSLGDLGDNTVIPAGTTIELVQDQNFPFFLADFTTDQQQLKWIEPRFIINDNLPSGTTVFLDCYVYDQYGAENFFFINQGYSFLSGKTNIIPEGAPKRIDNADLNEIARSETVYLRVRMVFSQDFRVGDLKNAKLYVQLAMRAKMSVNTSL